MTARTLLADDHTLFREALRSLLERADGIEVVGEASDGEQAEAEAARLAPDVVVMDVSMPRLSGIEATRRLRAVVPQVRVIALSAFVYKRFVVEMLGAGASGYLAKSSAGEELVRAIHNVMQGKIHLCPEAAAALVETLRPDDASPPSSRGDSRLGRRELEVLRLLAEGMSSGEIGSTLHIAPGTVDVHRRNIMRKLGLHSVVELTRYAIREGLISP